MICGKICLLKISHNKTHNSFSVSDSDELKSKRLILFEIEGQYKMGMLSNSSPENFGLIFTE